MFRFRLAGDHLRDEIQLVSWREGKVQCQWVPVRPIPEEENWFETVWEAYMENRIMDD